jgi:hypothetical protein
VFSDLGGSEFGPCCHASLVDGMAPGGDGGQTHAGVIESDAFADGVVGDGGVCSVDGNGVGLCCGFGTGG